MGKLTQLTTSELKYDSPSSFCLNSNDNCMVFNNSSDVTIFEPMFDCDSISLMPYSIKQVKVSQDKPISKILREVDLVSIYRKATTQESQELACDIVYTAECSVEPVKARVLQADLFTKNNETICCALTNYGCCEFYEKDGIIKNWKIRRINLVNILFTEVFPPQKSPSRIQTYSGLKDFTAKLLITCFKISQCNGVMIIYLGTAAGYIVALKYNETSCKFEPYCNLKTSMNRISYLTTCNNFILAGCNQGRVLILKLNAETLCLQELEYLWSVTDGMSCQKALFAYSEEMSCFLVTFCKASHILIFRLNKEGTIECSSTSYVSGIKITGIESISDSEFIITTITGAVKHIKVSCPTSEEVLCEEQSIAHDFDSKNYQILGVGASISKYLWSFLLFRNKDYQNRSKYSATTAFVNVCKLSCQDSFDALPNLYFKNLNIAQDLILSVSLNIFNNLDIDKYVEFTNLKNLSIPNEISDTFLQRLQVQLMVTRKLSKHQLIKYKKLKEQTKMEFQIVEHVLQLQHILQRMRYLKGINNKKMTFSKFQQSSLMCMQLQFNHLLGNLCAVTGDDETTSELCNVAKEFAEYFRSKISQFYFDIGNIPEILDLCEICNTSIEHFKKCQLNHDVKRCSISYTQLSLFRTKYCPHCYSLARNDDEANLQELYAADECITCIYCRFPFKEDAMQFISEQYKIL